MDINDDYYFTMKQQEEAEEEEKRRKLFIKDLQNIAEKNVENLGTWENINLREISEKTLTKNIKKYNLENDEQTRIFCKFISIATNFASVDFSIRLSVIPELIVTIKELFDEMLKEVKEYADIVIELKDIINCFIKMVMDAKHKANMILPHLKDTENQLLVIKEILNIDQELKNEDKKDIDLALGQMQVGINNLLNLAEKEKNISFKIEERITNMKKEVLNKKLISEGRLDFIDSLQLQITSPIFGGIIGLAAFGLTIDIPSTGLVIYGMTLSPISALISASAIGAISIGSIFYLVKKLWEGHQTKAIYYLHKILEELEKINESNIHFLMHMNKSLEISEVFSINLNQIKLCILSKRQRNLNKDICDDSIKNLNSMISCLEMIKNINLQNWIENQKLYENNKIVIFKDLNI